MTPDEMTEIVSAIKFRDWRIVVRESSAYYLQVQFLAPDADCRTMSMQHGRKWLLSPHMTRTEIVGTALKAVLAAVEHEAREDFMFEGVRVFGPHVDIDALKSVADQTDTRNPINQ